MFFEQFFLPNDLAKNHRVTLTSVTPVELVLALDAGTSGVRTVAFDVQRPSRTPHIEN